MLEFIQGIPWQCWLLGPLVLVLLGVFVYLNLKDQMEREDEWRAQFRQSDRLRRTDREARLKKRKLKS